MRKLYFHGYPLMLVGYMRVSSDSDRQNTDLQRDALLAAGVDARHLYEDRASGAKDDRSGLTQALEFVRPGDVLVVWKLDRLGRSLSHLLAIVNTLKEKHVSFRSLTAGMDTTTASGELLFHVFGALAQYERAMIQERVIAGLAAAKRRVGGLLAEAMDDAARAALAQLLVRDDTLSQLAALKQDAKDFEVTEISAVPAYNPYLIFFTQEQGLGSDPAGPTPAFCRWPKPV